MLSSRYIVFAWLKKLKKRHVKCYYLSGNHDDLYFRPPQACIELDLMKKESVTLVLSQTGLVYIAVAFIHLNGKQI